MTKAKERGLETVDSAAVQVKSIAPQPEVAPQPPKVKKVAIIGFTEHRMLAPFNDDWEIWGLNELYSYIPRWDRWFEIHDRVKVKATPRDPQHLAKLQAMKCPIFMWEHYDDIPNSVRYPIELMVKEFGSYFTNSISYMLALAIYEGYQEIAVYGVNMAHQTEYAHQKPSCEYFLGIAVGRGIKITLPLEADLLKAKFLYGYQEEERNAYNAKLLERKEILRAKIEELRQVREQKRQQWQAEDQALNDSIQQHLGAMQDVDFHLVTWDVPMVNPPGKPGG